MNDYRPKSIVAAYSTITGNKNVQSVLDILKKSYTFNEIMKGDNDAINYDSTIANLLDIVAELSQTNECPDEIKMITEESLVNYFAAIRAANLAATDISFDDYTKELMVM